MKCDNSTVKQLFLYNHRMEIIASEFCLDAVGKNAPVTLYHCHNLKGNQQWQYNSMVKLITYCQKRCLEIKIYLGSSFLVASLVKTIALVIKHFVLFCRIKHLHIIQMVALHDRLLMIIHIRP